MSRYAEESVGTTETYTDGKDYRTVKTPFATREGSVEVLHFFRYGDGMSYAFAPKIAAWALAQGDKITLTSVPAILSPEHASHSKMFYALQALGEEERVAPAVNKELYEKRSTLRTSEAQADFVAQQGVDRQKFCAAYDSARIYNQVQKVKQYVNQYQIETAPLVVINATYVTGPAITGDPHTVTPVMDFLVASSRASS